MRKYTKKEIENAIKGTGAIISVIAKRLECSWETAKKNIDKHESAVLMLREEREATLDMAESTIMNSIQSGDVQTAKWYLTTIGRQRGFSEKIEITGKDNKDLIPDTINIKFTK